MQGWYPNMTQYHIGWVILGGHPNITQYGILGGVPQSQYRKIGGGPPNPKILYWGGIIPIKPMENYF